MELENDLRKLRLATPPAILRARILRDVQKPTRHALIPPWFAAVERHWLYPGRVPAAALLVAWLVIASFRVTTPAALFPAPTSALHISPDDFVRLEMERYRVLAQLQADQSPPAQPPNILPPRS